MNIGKYRNPDGTWNGVGVMAEITGLSQAEVRWTFDRLKHLMHVEKKPRAEALAVVKEEARSRPWEQAARDA